MTSERIREALLARPFVPFTLRTADGRAFKVRHPEFMSMSQKGRTIVVHYGKDEMAVVDLLLVTSIVRHPRAESA